MADIISELISFFKIKDFTSDIGKAGQGGKTGPPDWASPGAEVEGVVLGESGKLDLISVGGQTIKARADAHLPVGATVRFQVMDAAASPIKVKLLSVVTQPKEENQAAMSSLAVKAGVPRAGRALASLFTVLSSGGKKDPAPPDQLQQPMEQGAPVQDSFLGTKTVRQQAFSVINTLSYGDRPEPEKIQAFFALMPDAAGGKIQHGGPSLKTILKNVLDGLVAARNLDGAPVHGPEEKQGAAFGVSGRPTQGPFQGEPASTPVKNALSSEASFESFSQIPLAKETANAADVQVRHEMSTMVAEKNIAVSKGISFLPDAVVEPSRIGQPSAARNAPGAPDTSAPTLNYTQIDISVSAVLKNISEEALTLALGTRREAAAAGVRAGVEPIAVQSAAGKPPAKEGPVQKAENGPDVLMKQGTASSDEPRAPQLAKTASADEFYARTAPHDQLKEDVSYQVLQQTDSSHIFDAKTRDVAMENVVQGLKTLLSHIDNMQDYQNQVQGRLNVPFFVVPFWFENAAGFGNFSWWNERGADKTRDSSQGPVSHLIFDMELSGLGPVMMHVTLHEKALDLLLAARQDSLSEIRSGLSGLRGRIQGLGLKLEISGIIPIDEADQADFAGPLAAGNDGSSLLHLVT